MRVPTATAYDPAALAHAVRELALEAHLLLNDSAAELSEIRHLVERITDLQQHVAGYPHHELTRWLESARRRIEAA